MDNEVEGARSSAGVYWEGARRTLHPHQTRAPKMGGEKSMHQRAGTGLGLLLWFTSHHACLRGALAQ